jgi:TRAP-type mannitol/chloroaromatic compound transport system permease large subunit
MKAIPQRIFGTMTNEILMAVPLFVFMGTMLEKSKVAEELLENMDKVFRKVRGGLGISVSIVGALLAASTGIVGATVVTMGLLSLPTMLKKGYDPKIATGTVAAAGTLGQIIPPSIVLVLLGDVLSNAYQKSQLDMGVFSPETLSVGDLFAGALIPGLLLVCFYIIYQIFKSIIDPSSIPAVDNSEYDDKEKTNILFILFPPLFLIISVLGSILSGFATPTEAASVGAIGSILLASFKTSDDKLWPIISAIIFALLIVSSLFLDLRVNRVDSNPLNTFLISLSFVFLLLFSFSIIKCLKNLFDNKILSETAYSTTKITSMVFIILIGATFFSLVFRGLGGDETIEELLLSIPGGVIGAVIGVMVTMFILGFFLDFIEITFVVVPLVAPILFKMGIDPVWLGVMMAINLQTSFLTPPFGFALFYLRGVAPDTIKTIDIYKGVIPFIFIQIFMLILLSIFPIIATWLPGILL